MQAWSQGRADLGQVVEYGVHAAEIKGERQTQLIRPIKLKGTAALHLVCCERYAHPRTLQSEGAHRSAFVPGCPVARDRAPGTLLASAGAKPGEKRTEGRINSAVAVISGIVRCSHLRTEP